MNYRLPLNLRFSPFLENVIDYWGLSTSELYPSYALSDSIWHNAEKSRLATLGCWVLSNDPLVDKSAGVNSTLWLGLLPKLVQSTRTAYFSAAAFGAVYESVLLSNSQPTAETRASTMYSDALFVLQKDLTDQSIGPVPLLISCVLLAA